MGPRFVDLTPTRDTAYERRLTTAAKAGGYAVPEGTGGAPAFLERRFHTLGMLKQLDALPGTGK
jgi:hypothetical protein